jgi:excisionase family DNA binding protein
MKTESDQSQSERILTSNENQRAEQDRLTVKEVAHRLGVSLSTIYRVDRDHGPFAFIVIGRRIFIDLASFESYLASTRGLRANDDQLGDDNVGQCRQAALKPESESQTDALQIEPSKTKATASSLPASKSGGQRELIMRESSPPRVICYPWFMV